MNIPVSSTNKTDHEHLHTHIQLKYKNFIDWKLISGRLFTSSLTLYEKQMFRKWIVLTQIVNTFQKGCWVVCRISHFNILNWIQIFEWISAFGKKTSHFLIDCWLFNIQRRNMLCIFWTRINSLELGKIQILENNGNTRPSNPFEKCWQFGVFLPNALIHSKIWIQFKMLKCDILQMLHKIN
jgi:hypothetical protein